MSHFPDSWRTLLAEHAGPGLDAALSRIEADVARREASGIEVFPPRSLRFRALP